MTTVSITHVPGESKGRYVARVDGHDDVGELTYSRTSSRLIIADHTEVPDSLRGKGVGAALTAHVVNDARQNDFKIVPLCPFFKSQIDRNPDWSDVLQR